MAETAETGPQHQGRPNTTFPRHPEATYVVPSRSPHVEAGGGGNTEWSWGSELLASVGWRHPQQSFYRSSSECGCMFVPAALGHSWVSILLSLSFLDILWTTPSPLPPPNSQGGSCCLSASHPALHPPCPPEPQQDSEFLDWKSRNKGQLLEESCFI